METPKHVEGSFRLQVPRSRWNEPPTPSEIRTLLTEVQRAFQKNPDLVPPGLLARVNMMLVRVEGEGDES